MTSKILTLAAFILGFTQTPYAQTLHQHVNIGLVYPLSTNGVHAGQYNNLLSLNAIAGVSASENGLCLAGVSNTVKDSASGLVAAGVVNVIGGNAKGVLAAGVVNIVKGQVTGMQASGFINVCGSINGIQTAGFCNVARGNVNGLQYAGFVNKARNVNVQYAGFTNIADSVRGGQFAGFNNTALGTVNGVQVAGFSNEAQNVHTQISGFINTARNVEGAQIAGFINVAKKVKGVQLSGFMNIADSSDYPIGLINLIKKGEKAIGVSVDETGTTMATFRSGGRVLYGMVGAGINNYKSDGLYAIGAGLGAHLLMTKHFRINVEAAVNTLSGFNNKYFINTGLRIYPSFKIARVELYGGPSINYGAYSRRLDNYGVSNTIWSSNYYSYKQDLHFGVVGGVQVHI